MSDQLDRVQQAVLGLALVAAMVYAFVEQIELDQQGKRMRVVTVATAQASGPGGPLPGKAMGASPSHQPLPGWETTGAIKVADTLRPQGGGQLDDDTAVAQR